MDTRERERRRVQAMLIHGPRQSIARLAMTRLVAGISDPKASAIFALWWSPLHLGAELDPHNDRHWRRDHPTRPRADLRGVLGTIEGARSLSRRARYTLTLEGWNFEAAPIEDDPRALRVHAWPLTQKEEEAPCLAS